MMEINEMMMMMMMMMMMVVGLSFFCFSSCWSGSLEPPEFHGLAGESKLKRC